MNTETKKLFQSLWFADAAGEKANAPEETKR